MPFKPKNNLVRFLLSRVFLFNIAAASAFIVVLIWLSFKVMAIYSNHGETITVPDLRGMTAEDLDETLSSRHLEYSITDSTFVVGKEPGEVIEQNPKPLSKVKENRTIYITVNAINPPKIKMPDLKDVSLRQASLILESWGLKTGELIYKHDIARNAVLDQKVNGETIKPGTLIEKGKKVDLVLGDGLGTTKTEIPSLKGLSYEEALFLLQAHSLNLGAVVADSTVKDTSAAVIYRQIPDPSASKKLSLGESIDIFITSELNKKEKQDSVNVN